MKKFNFLNKMFWLLVALSASAVFFNSCEKDDDNDKSGVKSAELEEFGYDGDMPDELLEFFASLPKYRGADYSISTEPILRSTQAEQSDKLSRIFMDMISDAVFLSTYAPPGQKKLVYKWGSKDPGLLSVASPKYNKDGTIRPDTPSCKDSVYGLDCSGLIYQLFKLNNVLLNNNVLNKQYVAEQINGIMKMKTVQDINVKARKLEIGKVSVANLKTGDIIYYVSNGEAYHIGMFYKENDNQVVLFQSLGSWDKTCEENAAESMNRGVGGVTMDNTTLGKHLMKYKNRCNIIRIETDNMLDGTWVGPDKYCAVTIDGSSGAF
ncbi:MAG: C40 family peptidase, partial [Prevotellaceae bacterium]|nr:C40 family peptidase [Prevotellaceae bacterium]